jgi:hypothetical protein
MCRPYGRKWRNDPVSWQKINTGIRGVLIHLQNNSSSCPVSKKPNIRNITQEGFGQISWTDGHVNFSFRDLTLLNRLKWNILLLQVYINSRRTNLVFVRIGQVWPSFHIKFKSNGSVFIPAARLQKTVTLYKTQVLTM